MDLLIQQRGFEPDVRDGMGWTPLMCACSVRDGEGLVEKLVGRGADVGAKSECILGFSGAGIRIYRRVGDEGRGKS